MVHTPPPPQCRRDFLRWAMLAGGLPLLAAGCAGRGRAAARAPLPAVEMSVLESAATPSLLAAPVIDRDRVLRFAAGLRPFRSGRVRIESETLGGKLLIHNYGHGGAGVTLSWGSAAEVLRLLGRRPALTKIAVLGAGVIGLTAAHDLLRAGHRVRIYTKATLAQTTSWVAGAQWAPSMVARGHLPGDPDFFRRLLRESHARFNYLAEQPRWGVHHRLNFVAGEPRGGLAHIPADLVPLPEPADPLPLAGVSTPGLIYRTMLIEPPVFLPRLSAEVAQLGGTTEVRTFTSLADVEALPEPVVVNCLGLGAREVVGDARLVPLRGQLVHLHPQPLPYLLSHATGYIFPRSDALVLGGTIERGVEDPTPDEATCLQILERNRRFFL